MDSTAYRYLIDELRPETRGFSDGVPLRFAQAPVAADNDAFAALSNFIGLLVYQSGNEARRLPRPLLVTGANRWFFGQLFVELLSTAISCLADNSIPSATLRRNATELFRLLIDSITPRGCRIIDNTDVLDHALFLFSLETCMHSGWCPNTLEAQGKRAAHLFFNHLRKFLITAETPVRAAAFCFLWGAWLMAQKTEGIRDKKTPPETGQVLSEYEFLDGAGFRRYSLYSSQTPDLFFLLRTGEMSHPFTYLVNEGIPGIRIIIGNEEASVAGSVSDEQIKRRFISGRRRSCPYGLNGAALFEWIQVVQVLESTLYRIDVFKPLPGIPASFARIHLDMENSLELKETSPGRYHGTGQENFVLRFIENPFRMVLNGRDGAYMTHFVSAAGPMIIERPVQMITAWSTGKGIHDINHTNLLGIHDL